MPSDSDDPPGRTSIKMPNSLYSVEVINLIHASTVAVANGQPNLAPSPDTEIGQEFHNFLKAMSYKPAEISSAQPEAIASNTSRPPEIDPNEMPSNKYSRPTADDQNLDTVDSLVPKLGELAITEPSEIGEPLDSTQTQNRLSESHDEGNEPAENTEVEDKFAVLSEVAELLRQILFLKEWASVSKHTFDGPCLSANIEENFAKARIQNEQKLANIHRQTVNIENLVFFLEDLAHKSSSGVFDSLCY